MGKNIKGGMTSRCMRVVRVVDKRAHSELLKLMHSKAGGGKDGKQGFR